MCIIVVKPKGKLVSKKTLKNCFDNNSDGAGYVYHNGKENVINKGFFTFKSFYNSYKTEVKKEYPAIIHFRIATAGKVDGGNCHPFPLVGKLSLLRTTYLKTRGICVAHNGVIDINIKKKKVSDTIQFIQDILSKSIIKDNLYQSETIQKLVEIASGGKLAFINGKGKLLLLGNFIEDKGLFFSNDSYQKVWIKYDWEKLYYGYDKDYGLECDVCGKHKKDVHYDSFWGLWLCEECKKRIEEGDE